MSPDIAEACVLILGIVFFQKKMYVTLFGSTTRKYGSFYVP